MKRNLDSYAPAPTALISGIAATCEVPSIVDARVGRDGSIYLKVFENYDFNLDSDHVVDIADFCGVLPEDVAVERSAEDPEEATVVVSRSCFDFSAQFVRPTAPLSGMPGLEDSEEGVEALVALAAARRA